MCRLICDFVVRIWHNRFSHDMVHIRLLCHKCLFTISDPYKPLACTSFLTVTCLWNHFKKYKHIYIFSPVSSFTISFRLIFIQFHTSLFHFASLIFTIQYHKPTIIWLNFYPISYITFHTTLPGCISSLPLHLSLWPKNYSLTNEDVLHS